MAATKSSNQAPRFAYSVEELAAANGCSKNTIYALINAGKLRAFTLNANAKSRKSWRVSVEEWKRFVDAGGTLNLRKTA